MDQRWKNFSPEKSKSAATDDDELDSDEAYNAETDVDDDGDDEDDFPPLPDFFAGRVFVLFVADSGLRKVIPNFEGIENETSLMSYDSFTEKYHVKSIQGDLSPCDLG